jgi:hypothetical protein
LNAEEDGSSLYRTAPLEPASASVARTDPTEEVSRLPVAGRLKV